MHSWGYEARGKLKHQRRVKVCCGVAESKFSFLGTSFSDERSADSGISYFMTFPGVSIKTYYKE